MGAEAEHFEKHIPVEEAGRVAVDLLHQASGLSRQALKSAMTKGAVWLTRGRNTRRLRRAKRELHSGDELHLYYDKAILDEEPAEPLLVADAGGYSVWNKPCGLRSQGSKWGDHCTVARWAEQHLQPERPAFVVHRLDRAANGLILVAHSKTVAAALADLFRAREIEKRYYAWVAGDFSSHPASFRVEESIDGRPATSEFTCRLVEAGRSLVDVRLLTGRKHQIRRHLAGLGYPIIGDRLHGTGTTCDVDLQLSAYLLAFRCPVSGMPVEYQLGLATAYPLA